MIDYDDRFQLRFFCIEEDGSTDYVSEGFFETLEQALDRLENIGSRWIFYPNADIVHQGKVIETFVSQEQ
jgi:hypothetical protein